jgi:hypothetical protein
LNRANYQLGLLIYVLEEQLVSSPISSWRGARTWLEAGVALAQLRAQLTMNSSEEEENDKREAGHQHKLELELVSAVAVKIHDYESFCHEFAEVIELATPFVRFTQMFEKLKASFAQN